MGATISKLAVKLQADTAGFKSGMGTAKTAMSKFGQSAGGAIGPLKGLIGPLVGAAAAALTVGAAIKGVSSAMSRLDEVTKKAKSMEMSTDALMGLQHAAEQAGVSSDMMAKSMQKLQKNIGLALIDQAGPAHDALAQLGLDVNAVGAMSPEKQFLAIADALKNVANPAERAALAVDLFGKAGQDLTILTNQGSEAIQAQIDELKTLQGTLSETDTANIEAANDAWHKVGLAVEGVFNQIAAAWAPISEELGSDMASMMGEFANLIADHKGQITSALGTIAEVVKNTTAAVYSALKTIMDVFKSIGISSAETAIKIAAFAAGLTLALKIIPMIVAGIKLLIISFKALASAQSIQQAMAGPKGWAMLAVSVGVAAAAVAGVDAAFASVGETHDKNSEKLNKIVEQTNGLADATNATLAAEKEKAKVIADAAKKRGGQLLEQNKTQSEKYADQLKEIDQLVQDKGLTAAEGAKLTAKVEAKIQSDIDKIIDNQNKQERQRLGAWEKAADNAAKKSTSDLVRFGSKKMFEMISKEQFKKDNPLATFQKRSTKIGQDQLTALRSIDRHIQDQGEAQHAQPGAVPPPGAGAAAVPVELGA